MAQEGFIEVPGGRVWYRLVGGGGTPLLCLHGGPGFTRYYLEPLDALSGWRQVIFYDQLGCGLSVLARPGRFPGSRQRAGQTVSYQPAGHRGARPPAQARQTRERTDQRDARASRG